MRRSMMSLAIMSAAAAGFMHSAFAHAASVVASAHKLIPNEPPPARGKGNRSAKRASIKRKNKLRERRTARRAR